MEGKRKPPPDRFFLPTPNLTSQTGVQVRLTHILLRTDQPQKYWGSLQCAPVVGEEKGVLGPHGPLRGGGLLTIVVSVVWVRIAGAAASSGFRGGGAVGWVGPGVCQPRVGGRAEAPGWPGGEHVDAGGESRGGLGSRGGRGTVGGGVGSGGGGHIS